MTAQRLLPIGDDPHAVKAREQGWPWCDTCKRPAVLSEFYGLLHTSVEHPFGAPALEKNYDHAVTTSEWWATPT